MKRCCTFATFIASFAFVLQRHRAKHIPLKSNASKGSLREGAPDAVGWGRARYNEVSTNLKSRRLLPSRCACHLPLGGRLFVAPIMTQIGRENNISAENYVSRTVEDAGPYNFVNILMRINLKQVLFLWSDLRFNRRLKNLNHWFIVWIDYIWYNKINERSLIYGKHKYYFSSKYIEVQKEKRFESRWIGAKNRCYIPGGFKRE